MMVRDQQKEDQVASLGTLEAAVMEVLWNDGEPLSVRQVLERLPPERGLAYTTVMTVLERLARKGVLLRHEQRPAFLYEPKLSRASYTAQLMTQVLADSTDRTTALVHFAQDVAPTEAQALWEALDERRRHRWRRSRP